MRVGCLQFDPRHGDVGANIDRANGILDMVGERISVTVESELDFLVLPKMAFSGSEFAPGKIEPYLEPAGGKDTRMWAKTAAIKYNCDVVVGYPQKVDDFSAQHTSDEFFSSAIMTNHEGENIANSPERTLNREFPLFTDIDTTSGRVSIGQYTDFGDDKSLNERECQAFADHILSQGIDIAIFPMAWETKEPPIELSRKSEHSKNAADTESKQLGNETKRLDLEALNCWTARLRPIVEAKLDREIVVVLCNRVGRGGNVVYAGTSAVLRISGGEVLVHEHMNSHQEGILLVDTSEPARWRLGPPHREVHDGREEHDSESVATADSPQSGPLTPDTSYRGSEVSQELLCKPEFDDWSIPSELDAPAAVRVYTESRKPRQPVTAKRQARPKLDLPKSTSKPPQEILVNEYRARAAAAPKPKSKASAPKVRSPEASTPHPGRSHGRLHWCQTRKECTGRMLGHPATGVTATRFEDPTTAISSSPQCWNGPWAEGASEEGRTSTRQARPACPNEPEQVRLNPPVRPKAPRAGRSQPPRSAEAGSGSVGRTNRDAPPAIKRPISPKSRNVKILEPLMWPSGEAAHCGVIPILASPSIMTTDSQAGSETSRGRRRRQKRPEEYEENSRSSSRDSTCHGMLHLRVRRSDVEDDSRRRGAQRSRSAPDLRPRDTGRSASLPAVTSDRGRRLGAVRATKAPRSES